MNNEPNEPRKTDISKLCCCLERAGDNPNCPVHFPKQVSQQIVQNVVKKHTSILAVIEAEKRKAKGTR